jgi:LPS-assembly protein
VKRCSQKPHGLCGVARIRDAGERSDGLSPRTQGANRAFDVRAARLLGFALLTAGTLLAALPSNKAAAQDPSIRAQVGSDRFFKPAPGGPFGPQPKINNAAPLYLQGDDLVYDTKGNKIIARGNVQIYYNNFLLTGDQITYDQGSNRLLAEGNVQLRDPNGNITRAERIEATDDLRDAFVESLSVISRDETRIQARRSIRRDGNVTEFEQGKFTPCKSDPGKSPLWCISGSRIIHDQKAATLTYQDAKFELFGTPVLALPYFQMPDPSVRHRTGFLAPTIGSSTSLGTFFELPYYIALDKSYDFLFSPSILSKQGVLYKGEWRQRLENGEYSVKFGAINQRLGALGADATPDLKGWRGTVESRGTFSLSSWWRAGWDVTLESDKSFRRFYGLDSILQTDRLNTAYLTGQSERNYFNASLFQFGNLLPNDTDVNKSRVLPVIDYNYVAAQPVLGGELSFNGHVRSLSRIGGDSTFVDPVTQVVKTQRLAGGDSTHLVTDVNWRRKLIDPIGQTWTPFANVRGDIFQFKDTRDPLTGLPAADDTQYRGVGAVGLTYAYPFVASTATASHVLEPVVQVVSRTTTGQIDQRRLPNEDAKSVSFDDTSLFFESKSTGFDRIDTGSRLNYGSRYSFQTNSGFNVRAVVGQSQHFAGTNVFADPGKDVTSTAAPGTFASAFSENNGLATRRSDYVAGLYVSPLQSLSLVTQGRFDTNSLALRRQDTLLTAGFGPFSTQLAYAFTRADTQAITGLASQITQQELQGTLGVKLTDSWSIAASLRYDIDNKQRLQDLFQVRYADECFVLTASYSEAFIANAALGVVPDRTVMVRFELKNLGGFSTNTNTTSFLSGINNQTNRN